MQSIVPNYTKQKLQAGKVTFGLGIRFFPRVELARMVGAFGYDWIYIDMQHNALDIGIAAQMCATALDVGVTPLIRVPSLHSDLGTRLLDYGAQGVAVPNIRNAAEAREMVRLFRFEPLGERSVFGPPIQVGWQKMPATEYTRILNEHMLLSAIIESDEGLANVEEIAAVEGIDIITVGTNDLTASLGIPGEYDNPKLLEGYKRIVAAASKHGKFVKLGGIVEPRLLHRAVEYGSRLVAIDNDARLFMKALDSGIAALRQGIDPALF